VEWQEEVNIFVTGKCECEREREREMKKIKKQILSFFNVFLRSFFNCSILFKFALDSQLSSDLWMYGGRDRRDEYAMKAAAKELQGLGK
jgi:hypothetical protein